MRTWKPWARWALVVLLGMGLGAAWAQKDGMKLSNFRVPDYNDRNEKKTELVGEEAYVLPDGRVDIRNFQLDVFQVGTTNIQMRVTAPQCFYNRDEQIAKSDTGVKIEGEKFVVTGDNFAWDSKREVFKIFTNSQVVLQRDPERLERLNPKPAGD